MSATRETLGQASTPEWMQRKERGSMFWLRVMSAISLGAGRRASRLVVYGIALYFLLFAGAARTASRDYLARALGRKPGVRDLYKHVLTFASTVHDRMYLLNDRYDLFDVQCVSLPPQPSATAGAATGAFLFGAHLGSFEVLRAAARWGARNEISVAMYPENARQINQALAAINPQAVSNIIALGRIDSILTIHQRMEEGGMVGILADRAVGAADQYVSLPFLGEPADFPIGPFRLAAMMKQPVYFMTGLYREGKRYDMHFELLSDFKDLSGMSRNAVIRELMSRYVATLERFCRQAPYNWFNFYDFWGDAHREAS
jgi:predicted LPLAT superfamily acyltransferase